MAKDQSLYWLEESLESLDTAKILLNNKKYLESAYFCHLSFEKIIKAFIVLRKSVIPPKSHNLLQLARLADLTEELDEETFDILADLNVYQIEGRYPENRKMIYEQTSPEEFTTILRNTEEKLQWFVRKLRSEKSSTNS